jgi:hypothetical protein
VYKNCLAYIAEFGAGVDWALNKPEKKKTKKKTKQNKTKFH